MSWNYSGVIATTEGKKTYDQKISAGHAENQSTQTKTKLKKKGTQQMYLEKL